MTLILIFMTNFLFIKYYQLFLLIINIKIIYFYQIFKNYCFNKQNPMEIYFIIERFKSYLASGLQPSQAVELLLNKKISTKNYCYLYKINQLYKCGKNFKEALEKTTNEIENNYSNQHIKIFLTSILIGLKSSGNLIFILEKSQIKIKEQILVTQKIKAYTSQIRLQAVVIGLSPLFLSLFIWIISPLKITYFFTDSFGNILLIIMIFLNIIGFYFLNLISRQN
jgi:Flp pilus assembly protein TadB